MKDKTDKAYLEYCFLVPTGVWSSIFDFEKDLAQFFESKGLEASVLNNSKGNANFKRIIDLDKKPDMPLPMPQAPITNTSPSQKLKDIAGESPNVKPVGNVKTSLIKPRENLTAPQLRFKKGRFLKRKGYFQRKAY